MLFDGIFFRPSFDNAFFRASFSPFASFSFLSAFFACFAFLAAFLAALSSAPFPAFLVAFLALSFPCLRALLAAFLAIDLLFFGFFLFLPGPFFPFPLSFLVFFLPPVFAFFFLPVLSSVLVSLPFFLFSPAALLCLLPDADSSR